MMPGSLTLVSLSVLVVAWAAFAGGGVSSAIAQSATPAPKGPAAKGAAAPAAKARVPDASRIPAQTDGEYFSRIGDCVACHTSRGGEEFAGGLEMKTPFGTLYTPNITPDPETGIGKWSADDFWRALHDGKSRDGSLLYPAFPYPSHTRITRADADAIYGYIMTLKPVKKRSIPHQMQFPIQPAQPAAAVAGAVFRARRIQARIRASRPNGTAARTSCRGSATATRATRAASSRRDGQEKQFGGGLIPCRTGTRRRSRPIAKPASANGTPATSSRCCGPAWRCAAWCSGRWRRWSTTASST
jgi:mono/diheme cytochrome c family protein